MSRSRRLQPICYRKGRLSSARLLLFLFSSPEILSTVDCRIPETMHEVCGCPLSVVECHINEIEEFCCCCRRNWSARMTLEWNGSLQVIVGIMRHSNVVMITRQLNWSFPEKSTSVVISIIYGISIGSNSLLNQFELNAMNSKLRNATDRFHCMQNEKIAVARVPNKIHRTHTHSIRSVELNW